jgi:hypothetical protein
MVNSFNMANNLLLNLLTIYKLQVDDLNLTIDIIKTLENYNGLLIDLNKNLNSLNLNNTFNDYLEFNSKMHKVLTDELYLSYNILIDNLKTSQDSIESRFKNDTVFSDIIYIKERVTKLKSIRSIGYN